ncbi:MAG: hypothetical protein WAO98_03805 [Alphaproteobacteria bacterium]
MSRPSSDLINPQRFTFELWQENIFGGVAAHTFLVASDHKTNTRVFYEGLATDRKTGDDASIGFAERDDVRIYGDMQMRSLNSSRIALLYQTNDPIEAAKKVQIINAAAYTIDRGRHPYSLFTHSPFGRNYYKVNSRSKPRLTFNSNSVTRTLVDEAGFDLSHIRLRAIITPGWNTPIPLPASYRTVVAETAQKAKADPSVIITSLSHMTQRRIRYVNSDAPSNSINFLVKADSVFRPRPKPVVVIATQTAKP